jgi:putative transposase
MKLCEYKGVGVIEGTACIDHIHICLSIPPKYPVSSIVGYLKGKSAMILLERYSNLHRNFRGHSFWTRGYYVNTVGLDEARVRQYIKNQQVNPRFLPGGRKKLRDGLEAHDTILLFPPRLY